MLSSFWENIGKGLSEKWLERLFVPPFLFWGGGLLLWIGPANLPAKWNELSSLPVVTQSALLIGALLILVASSHLMAWLRLPILRLLEGYWPPPLRGLAARLAAHRQSKAEDKKRRWNTLIQKYQNGQLTWEKQRELARLEAWRQHTPRDVEDLMPTRLGDILKTAELRPRQRYGLDPVLLWPHLWLCLPENVRTDLSEAHAQLDVLTTSWAWGLLFALWTPAWPWAAAIALLWMAAAYGLALSAAATFADLLLAAIDTHRWALYESMHRPLPEQGEAERAAGEALTRFIQRGMWD